MDTLLSAGEYKKRFGAVFTPYVWAYKFVEEYYFTAWANGATILDPTAGEGVFLKVFLDIARERGIALTPKNIGRLYGVELNRTFVHNFHNSILSQFSIAFPENNFIQGDIFFQQKEIKADFLIGNPPWVNFSDLEETYKEKTKHLYIHYGLVNNPKDLLLGNARTDIATLVIAKVLYANLHEKGKALFFLPLSIFQNDGANQEFRNYSVRGVDFAVEEILDFNGEKVFDNILGRYGVARFQRDTGQEFPIKYRILKNNEWKTHRARPLFNRTDPLTVFDDAETESRLENFQKISLPKYCMPRQGVNTCGANAIFFFDTYEILDGGKVRIQNKLGDDIVVSKKYVFPLTVSTTLKSTNPRPEKVILIPHFDNGKPIDLETLKEDAVLFDYLTKYQSVLQNRKGVLINTWINRGFWWALMGVGEYSFASYKIMWKAFGDSVFSPIVLEPDDCLGSWQGNQSLNAYIGVSTLQEARQVLHKLANPLIQEYLSSLRMQGTCNWAQPGRMKKLMEFT